MRPDALPAQETVRSSSSSSSSNGSVRAERLREKMGSMPTVINPPHEQEVQPVPYVVVIPTYRRWQHAFLVNPHEKRLRNVRRPFILEKTLNFLMRQSIPKERVYLFVADADEAVRYEEALERTAWEGVKIVIGVWGIRAQRNFIVSYFPVGQYIVSIDDDVSNIMWKHIAGEGSNTLVPLPDGKLEALIYNAHQRMRTYDAYICGLNSTCSMNFRNMHIDGISTRNGEINGFFYFMINRHHDDLLPVVSDATEDAERSLRFFQRDRRVLRYRMYCGVTRCWQNQGGLQSLYSNGSDGAGRRKEEERHAAQRLHELFPDLTGVPKVKARASTLEIKFIAKGGAVIPSTTAQAFIKNCAFEAEAKQARNAAIAKRRERQSEQHVEHIVPAPVPDRITQGWSPNSIELEEAPCSPRPCAPDLPPDEATQLDDDDEDYDDDDDDYDDGDDDDDDDGDDAEDENAHLLSAIKSWRTSNSGSEIGKSSKWKDEAQLIVQAVLRSINGNFDNPLEVALNASQVAFQDDQERIDQEEEELRTAMQLSLQEERPAKRFRGASERESSAPDDDQTHIDHRAVAWRPELMAMGFNLDIEAVQSLYRDSNGDMSVAVAILLSPAS